MENTIDTWAEAIASLADKDFSNIMRLYLGKIKTPYNKQRLASQLASFLNNTEHSKTIISLLTKSDLEILSAIHFMPQITKENLIRFFSDSYKISEFYTRLLNLEERLLIYCVEDDGEKCFFINPILLPGIKPLLSIENLLCRPIQVTENLSDIFALNPNFLISFFSAVKNNSLTLKNDGMLKKNSISRLEEIFPGKTKCIELLVTSFLNLGILREGKKSLETDDSRLLKFSELSELSQTALLCAASGPHLSREGLRKESQLLLDCINSIPQWGYTKKTIIRLAFMIGSKSSGVNTSGAGRRFAQILQAARSRENSQELQNMSIIERMTESAAEFGLLRNTGMDENGEKVYTGGQGSFNNREAGKVLNIESTFSISLMPGLSLKKLLPLTNFLDAKKYGIVSQFELTRDSLTNAFDTGLTPEDIFNILSDFSSYEIPQNLGINIQEWYNSHSSALLYQGFVLKVKKENISFAENNPKLQKYIQEKISEGIYLLNLPADANVAAFLEECGLNFIKNVRRAKEEKEILAFPILQEGRKSFTGNSELKANGIQTLSEEESEKYFASLLKKLEMLEMDKNQKESLKKRIISRMIISEEQLSSEAVRTEILEADGMDFAGKMHLVEAAIKENDMIEITLPDAKGDKNNYITIVGKAESLVRSEADAVFSLKVEPSDELSQFYVSHITHLRRLHF